MTPENGSLSNYLVLAIDGAVQNLSEQRCFGKHRRFSDAQIRTRVRGAGLGEFFDRKE